MSAKNNLVTKASDFLMCSPTNFDVQYVINPWMQNNVNALNKLKAESQWNNLHGIIKSLFTVRVLDSVEGLLDMVFIANAALVIDNKCVVAKFKHRERQGETLHWHKWFLLHAYEILDLPENIYFEGEGDCLYDSTRQCIWGGYNMRSHKEAYPYIAEFFNKEVEALEMVQESLYHLDTCFSVLPNGCVMYVPDAFSKQSLLQIETRVEPEKRIILTMEEARDFTCNAVHVHDTVICNQASPRVVELLHEKGFIVVQTELSEFIKAGGAAKCLVLSLYQS